MIKKMLRLHERITTLEEKVAMLEVKQDILLEAVKEKKK